MAIIYLILALLIAVIGVIFAWQNPATVTITFFVWKVADVPLSLVLLVTLAIGILIGWLFVAPSLVRHSFRTAGQRKRIGSLEKELEDNKAKLGELQKPEPPTPPAPPPPVPASEPSDTDPMQHS